MSRQSDCVLFNSGTIEISGFINGDIVAEDKLFKISDYIREGKVTDLSQNNSIIIGKGSDKMLLIKGDIIKFQLLMGIWRR
jgi:lipoprotein-releasing system permease protein